MKRLKTWVAGTMTLALTIGGGLWAHHYVNAAPTGDASGTQSQSQDQGSNGKHDKRGAAPGLRKDAPGGKQMNQMPGMAFHFAVSDELAALLGLTKDELAQAIKSSKSIATIAGEKNVSVDSVVSLLTKASLEKLDKQLADGKLTQEQYDKSKTSLTDTAKKFVNGELGGKFGLPGGMPGFGNKAMGEGVHFDFRFAASDELAALLGTTKDELAQAIKSGKSIATIAGEKNVSVDSVIGLITKAPLEKLDKQLADGKLTQEQYDKAKTTLTDSAKKFVNGELGGKLGLPGGMPGPGKALGDNVHFDFRFAVSDELATLLGLTKDELAQAVKSGKSIATIAGEKNVSVDSVVSLLTKASLEKLDKQLADGKLTQEQYDKAKSTLTDSATKLVNGELGGKLGLPGGMLSFGIKGMGEGLHFDFRFAVSDELATLLGLTKDELAQAVKSGKSIATIAGEKNVSVDSVVSLLTKASLEKLDKQLADGKLTQEQYDKAKSTLTDSATKLVNGELGGKLGLPGGMPNLPFGHGQQGKDGMKRGKVGPGTNETGDNAASGSKANLRQNIRTITPSGTSGKTISS
ncbi:SHOCT domain-containing protein [Paenibacillus ginsengarvi]|uniref:SHOCT domain-containing protein n=1 Tax=Paenibacillus ginsengarvi TaxID=400777 RepID=A0A3B0C1X2_9BACL|nr:SHOCT domain-containing protein [Paenibacillus ginsengarvi]RKN78229.1 hypothetical protein D7M11_23260 [Paenibacillus ginsengarvi]